AACGGSSTSPTTATHSPTPGGTVSQSPTPGTTPTATTNPAPATAPVPPTQTSCPAAGTGRAAVTAPLALGSHQNIVYLVKQGPGGSTSSTLKRYDLTTGNKTVIFQESGIFITQAQISTDGQWILFLAVTANESKLQMVRMDGQGLQTLYCAQGSGLQNVQWSSKQRFVVFNQRGTVQTGVYLLDISSGSVQIELYPPPNNGFVVR